MNRYWTRGSASLAIMVLALMMATGSTPLFARGLPETGIQEESERYRDQSVGPRGRYGMPFDADTYRRPGLSEGYDERISLQDARDTVADALRYYGYEDTLGIIDMTEFEYSFYARIGERETAIIVYELLVDPYTGHIRPVTGRHMMGYAEMRDVGPGWMHHGPAGRGFREGRNNTRHGRFNGPDRYGRFDRRGFPRGGVDENR